MNQTRKLLAALDSTLPGLISAEDKALTESALRNACAAAAFAVYPDASGAEHEMDVRRLLRAVVEAYAVGGAHASGTPPTAHGEAVFDATDLRDAVRRLHAELR